MILMNHEEATLGEVKRSPAGCVRKGPPKAYTTQSLGSLLHLTNQSHKKATT